MDLVDYSRSSTLRELTLASYHYRSFRGHVHSATRSLLIRQRSTLGCTFSCFRKLGLTAHSTNGVFLRRIRLQAT